MSSSLWSGSYSHLPHGFFSDDRVLGAGDKAAMLLLRMSDFAHQHETDGVVSDRQVAQLGPGKGRAASLQRLSSCSLVARLETGDGWRIVDWLDGHRTAAQINDIRSKRRSAGKKSAEVKAKKRAQAKQQNEVIHKQSVEGVLNPETETETETETEIKRPPPPPDIHSLHVASPVVVEVADRLVRIVSEEPDSAADAGERRYVARALEQRWPIAQLEDAAYEATTAREPRTYLLACLRRRANEPPPYTTEQAIDLTGFGDPATEYSTRHPDPEHHERIP